MANKELDCGSSMSKEEGESGEVKANLNESLSSLQTPEKSLGKGKCDQSKNESCEGKTSSLEKADVLGSLEYSSRMSERRHLELAQKKKAENLHDPDAKSSPKREMIELGVMRYNDAIISQVEVEVEPERRPPECVNGNPLVSVRKVENPPETRLRKSNVKASNNANEEDKIWQLNPGETVNSATSRSTSSDGENKLVAKRETAVKVENDEQKKSQESDPEWTDIEEGESEQEGKNYSPHSPRSHKSGRRAHVNRARFVATTRRRQRRHKSFLHRQRHSPQSVTAKHLQFFLSFLYYSGMSPVKPKSAKGFPKWTLCLQAALYGLFTIISTVEIVDEVKFGGINFLANEGMFNFVILGFFVANCLTRIYNIYLLYAKSTPISNLLEKIEKMNTCSKPKPGRDPVKLAVYAIGTISVMLAGLSTVFGSVAINKWTTREAIKDQSFQFSQTLFIWSPNDYTNATEKLFQDYGKEITLSTGAFAVLGSIFNLFGTLHGCLILDLFPILTLQIYSLQKPLFSSLQRAKTTKEARRQLQINWKYYMNLRDICDDVNTVFGNQLKFIHAQNLLLFGYFLLRILNKNPVSVNFLIDLFCIVKVSVTYYYARKVGEGNDTLKDYVTKCSNHGSTIILDGKRKSVSVLLKDMKKHPIGIGRGDFFINESFILTFAGVMISSFLFLAAESNKLSSTCS